LGLAVGLLLASVLSSAATAATVTKTALEAGIPGFPTQPGGLGVFEADTPVLPPDAVREVGTYTVQVTADPAIANEAPFAGGWKAYAVTDVRYHTDNGVAVPMDLQLAHDAWAGEFLGEVPAQLTWLLRHADALIAAEADTARAAAAVQVVVWQTLRNPQSTPPLAPRADLALPTVDPAVNALAVRFTEIMQRGRAADDAAAQPLSIAAGPVTGCSATTTVTGTPGTPVALSVDQGGALSTRSVLLGPDGTATATVQGVGGATVSVAASVASGGVLVRADGLHEPDVHTTELNRSQGPEELIFLAGGQTTVARTPITCAPELPPLVNPPVSPPIVRSAGIDAGTLSLTKTAPPTAVAGRTITYRLRVRNTGSIALDAVVLRDVMPDGMSIVGLPRGATLKRGVVTWKLGSLAAGDRRVVVLNVRVDRTVRGTRCNSADAAAANAPTVTARACSTIRAVAGVSRLPIVAG
jgi:uncharacterized repeat protein (TIGR01451 family)